MIVAGLRHEQLPFDGAAAPLGLGITGSNRPTAVAFALWRALAEHPVVLAEAGALAAAAVVLPQLRGRGLWAAAGGGAALLAATALGRPGSGVPATGLAAWVTAAALVVAAKLPLRIPSEQANQTATSDTPPTRPSRGLESGSQRAAGSNGASATIASTRARSGPTRYRCSRLRRCDTFPTFAPAGL